MARIFQQKKCYVPSAYRKATHAFNEPSYYLLFLALQNFKSDMKLKLREYCKNRLLEFVVNKDHETCFIKQPLKWQQQNRPYLPYEKTKN